MQLSERFIGQAALVTGSSQGIGRALSERLSKEGATVFAVARNLPKLEELASENVGPGNSRASCRDHTGHTARTASTTRSWLIRTA